MKRSQGQMRSKEQSPKNGEASQKGKNQPATKEGSPHELEIQEAEDVAELEKLENNGKKAGTGGFKFRKTLFSRKITVLTGSIDLNSTLKISREILASHCASLQRKCFVIGGDSKAHFPDIKITLTSPTVDQTFVDESAKFFSMIIPTRMHSDSQAYRFFLRRGVEKSDNETMIELSESELKKIENVYSDVYGPYLKKLNGQQFETIEEIPKKPDAVVLRTISDRSNLTFRIDDFIDSGKNQKIFPNLSIRVWEYGRNGWHITRKGVTLSAYNCHYFVYTTIGIFLEQIKALFDNLHQCMQDVVYNFENAESLDEKIQEIEPFPT